MSTTLVDYRTEAGVAVITLTDPPMNSFTHDMMRELDECVLDARFDNDVQVIVMIGRGDRFFCAGPNFKMLSEVDAEFRYYFYLHASETLERLEQTPKLVIAALNGHAIGGGLEIALACDLRIARSGHARFGFPEVPMGLVPGLGGMTRLARLVGAARATRLVLEATPLSAEQAVAAGIVHETWEAPSREAFEKRAIAYARTFLPKGGAGPAVGRAKRGLGSALKGDLAFALERELQAPLWGTRDFEQEILAYLEEHSPPPDGAATGASTPDTLATGASRRGAATASSESSHPGAPAVTIGPSGGARGRT